MDESIRIDGRGGHALPRLEFGRQRAAECQIELALVHLNAGQGLVHSLIQRRAHLRVEMIEDVVGSDSGHADLRDA